MKFLRPRFAVFATALATFAAAHATPLPALNIDNTKTTVSGLSSGGFMAVQLHVAYSSTFKTGAGIVAGGPFYCAQGSLITALGPCMMHLQGIPVDSLVATTRSAAASNALDPVSNLQSSKVYLYSGLLDTTVTQAVMNDLYTYYRNFVPAENIVYKNNLASAHAMITDDYGNGCGVSASPYISNCNFDLAGAILTQLYGTLNPRNTGALTGNFIEFDQSAFISGHGMAPTAWAYVPQACAAGTRCKLHVALHGCQQNTATVGQQFVRGTGYNRWADTNNIVVLYPQTTYTAINGCWDWWGYDSASYASKSGPQMAAIKAMVDHLGSGSSGNEPPPPSSTLPAPQGLAASGATNTSMVLAWSAVQGAAGYNVYREGRRTNTALATGTTFTDTGLSPGTTYHWTVKAVDAAGAESQPSAAATGTTTGTGTGTPPPAASCFTASNFAHTLAGRAYVIWGLTYAKGSNQYIGIWSLFGTTTLKQTGPGTYVLGTCS